MPELRTLLDFARDEAGATAIEYGLLAALIAVSLIGGAQVLGPALFEFWEDIAAVAANAR